MPRPQAHTSRQANLGQVALRRSRSQRDPMQDYDALPSPLRAWLAQAVLPWSPRSCRTLWSRYRAAGLDTEACLAKLTRAEARLLDRLPGIGP